MSTKPPYTLDEIRQMKGHKKTFARWTLEEWRKKERDKDRKKYFPRQYSKNNKCVDCERLITNSSKRCRQCHRNYVKGNTIK